jgi:AcrR family transcriptional regulator
LLDAARRVIARDGATGLTLDAVAREAGRSKGTLLYHFPNKQALTRALLDDLDQVFGLHLNERLAAEPEAPGRWLRAYILATADDLRAAPEPSATIGVLALMVSDPELLGPWRERSLAWWEQARDDGLDPEIGAALLFAADGLWLADLFSMAPASGPERERLVRQLLDLTRTRTTPASWLPGGGAE